MDSVKQHSSKQDEWMKYTLRKNLITDVSIYRKPNMSIVLQYLLEKCGDGQHTCLSLMELSEANSIADIHNIQQIEDVLWYSYARLYCVSTGSHVKSFDKLPESALLFYLIFKEYDYNIGLNENAELVFDRTEKICSDFIMSGKEIVIGDFERSQIFEGIELDDPYKFNPNNPSQVRLFEALKDIELPLKQEAFEE